MIELAKKELKCQLWLEKKDYNYEKILKMYLLPKDEADSKNAILEIQSWNRWT